MNCKKWSDLVLQEFLHQGELEKAAGLPISPNMDPTQVNQAQTQLSFTQLIVQPLFECLLELFPKTLSLMDLIVDNIRQWGGVEVPYVPRRRATEEKPKGKKSLGAAPVVPKKPSDSSRRISLAAGTIEIPESIQKFFSKGQRPSRQSLRNASHRTSAEYTAKGENNIVEEEEEEEDEEEDEGNNNGFLRPLNDKLKISSSPNVLAN